MALLMTPSASMPAPPMGLRYKTQLCRHFMELGKCLYADKCAFAHGKWELRTVEQNRVSEAARSNAPVPTNTNNTARHPQYQHAAATVPATTATAVATTPAAVSLVIVDSLSSTMRGSPSTPTPMPTPPAQRTTSRDPYAAQPRDSSMLLNGEQTSPTPIASAPRRESLVSASDDRTPCAMLSGRLSVVSQAFGGLATLTPLPSSATFAPPAARRLPQRSSQSQQRPRPVSHVRGCFPFAHNPYAAVPIATGAPASTPSSPSCDGTAVSASTSLISC